MSEICDAMGHDWIVTWEAQELGDVNTYLCRRCGAETWDLDDD